MAMSPAEREKLEVLNGDRPKAADEAAMRLKHVRALLNNIPAQPTGDAAADIKALYDGLNALRTALR